MKYISKRQVAALLALTDIGPFIDPAPGSICHSKEAAMYAGFVARQAEAILYKPHLLVGMGEIG